MGKKQNRRSISIRPDVYLTDILERPLRGEPLSPLELTGTDDFYRYTVPYDPYEIVTLKITPSPFPRRFAPGPQEGERP